VCAIRGASAKRKRYIGEPATCSDIVKRRNISFED
jgi:hypothetical protein